MRCRSNAMLALSASVAVALGLALVPSAATAHTGAGAAAVKVPKIKFVKLDLDVAGYVETRRLKDTTRSCSPGVTYTQTNRYTFETGKYLRTVLTNVAVPGTDGVLTTGISRAAGSANIAGGITGFRTTNFCAPTPKSLPEPPPPKCVKTQGKTQVALTPAVKLELGDDDPVPLGGKPMMLSVFRSGGAQDVFGSCSGTNVGEVGFRAGPDTDNTLVTTSSHWGPSLSLSAALGSVKLFNLKLKRKGRRHEVNRDLLQRTIVLSGPCSSVRVSTRSGWAGGVPASGQLTADGDCWLTGKIVLSVRRSL